VAPRRDPIKKITLADGRTRYRFVVDVGKKPNGKRDQRTFTYDSLREARAERAQVISERAKGTYVKPDRKLTVEAYLTEWLETKRGKKPTTYLCYRNALVQVIDQHGHLPLQDLDVPDLEALKRNMLSGKLRRIGTPGEPLSPRTVNLMLTVVTMALRVALRRGLVGRNVGEIVERVAADPDAGADRGEWEAADAVAFLRSVRDDRLYAAFLLSLLGLRRGEVLGLRWDDVDLAGALARKRRLPKGTPSLAVVNNRVVVGADVVEGTPKGRGRRKVPYLPVPRLLVDALTALWTRQLDEREAAGEAYGKCPECGGAHVVVDELGGPYRPEWYSDRFVALGRAIGLARVPLHGGRHCAASLLADLGVPDVAAAAWLGHTQVQVTQGYQHVMVERLLSAGEALGEALAG
jgi:integrase